MFESAIGPRNRRLTLGGEDHRRQGGGRGGTCPRRGRGDGFPVRARPHSCPRHRDRRRRRGIEGLCRRQAPRLRGGGHPLASSWPAGRDRRGRVARVGWCAQRGFRRRRDSRSASRSRSDRSRPRRRSDRPGKGR